MASSAGRSEFANIATPHLENILMFLERTYVGQADVDKLITTVAVIKQELRRRKQQ